MNAGLGGGRFARRGLIVAALLAAFAAASLGATLIGAGSASASTTLLSWSAATPVDPVANNAMGISCVSTSVCVATDMEDTIWTTTNASSASPTWSSDSGTVVDSGGKLNAVSCVPGGSLCVAIDPAGNVFETNNPAGGASTWTSGGNIGGSNDAAISCPSTSLCTVVDESGNVLTSNDPADGSTHWTGPDSINGTWIGDVDCPSASLCVAVGINDKVLTSTTPTNHSTSSWPGVTVSDNPMFSVACTESASVCVTGDGGGDVYTSSDPAAGGSSWSTGTALSGGSGALVSATGCGSGSSGDICLVGDANGNIYESTDPTGGGSTFSAADPIDPGNKLWSISCPSTTFCIAGDVNGDVFYGTTSGTPTPTPTASSATTVVCNAFSAGTPIENFQCIASVAPLGGNGAQLPTGNVTFSTTDGGFPYGPTCVLSPGAGAATCTAAFLPNDGNSLTITAAYGGDGTFAASSGQLQLQPDIGSSPEQQLCIVFYSGECSGLVPPPDPVQTCISLVQNCNGFGGSGAAPPGTIDMGGFPGSLPTQAGCDQTGTNPYTTGGATGGSGTCTVEGTVTGNSDPDPGVDSEQQYNANVAQFQSDVDAAETTFFAQVGALDWSALGEDGGAAVTDLTNVYSPLFAKEKPAGQESVVNLPQDTSFCTKAFTGAAASYCVTLFNGIFNDLSGVMFTLSQQKEQLGVDVPYVAPEAGVRSASATLAKVKRKYKNHEIVLAVGQVKLRQGTHGKLVLHISRVERAILRHAARKGIRRIKGQLTITATHGTSVTQSTFRVRILLVAPKKKH